MLVSNQQGINEGTCDICAVKHDKVSLNYRFTAQSAKFALQSIFSEEASSGRLSEVMFMTQLRFAKTLQCQRPRQSILPHRQQLESRAAVSKLNAEL